MDHHNAADEAHCALLHSLPLNHKFLPIPLKQPQQSKRHFRCYYVLLGVKREIG
jgi:hypothetical protein